MLTYSVERYITGKKYIEGMCLSLDTKPTGDDICNGSSIVEMDTGAVYFYDEENSDWVEFGASSND